MSTKSIIKKELLTVFDLAKIAPDVTGQELFLDQITSILKYVEELSTIDIETTEPATHAVLIDCPLSADTAAPGSNRAEVMREAPQSADGYFVTPKFIPGH